MFKLITLKIQFLIHTSHISSAQVTSLCGTDMQWNIT